MKLTDSKEIKEITDFNQFSKESLIPFGVLVLENYQISVKLKNMTNFNRFQGTDQNEQILSNFQKRAFYRLLYLSEILPK